MLLEGSIIYIGRLPMSSHGSITFISLFTTIPRLESDSENVEWQSPNWNRKVKKEDEDGYYFFKITTRSLPEFNIEGCAIGGPSVCPWVACDLLTGPEWTLWLLFELCIPCRNSLVGFPGM